MKIGDAPVPVHEKMVKFLPTYYLELDKIPQTENLVSDDDNINNTVKSRIQAPPEYKPPRI